MSGNAGGQFMANRQWYTAIGGRQEGPFSDERLRQLIAAGTVRADSLVWCDGMSNWAKAAEIPGLMSGAPIAPQSATVVPAVAAAAPVVGDNNRLAFDPQRAFDRVSPLFWRVVAVYLSVIAVVPLPWVAPWFIGWFVEQIELPERRRIGFAGKPSDIWYIFILYALCMDTSVGLSLLGIGPASWLLIPLTAFLALVITRWVYANLAWPERSAPLQFTGSYLALLGWSVLAGVSILSIIGWAWVYTAWARWMCRNVQGSRRQLVFTSSGWSFLWRSVTFVLFGVAMPWILRWYVRWLVSRFALIGDSARSAGAA
jgi:hypothetical protein